MIYGSVPLTWGQNADWSDALSTLNPVWLLQSDGCFTSWPLPKKTPQNTMFLNDNLSENSSLGRLLHNNDEEPRKLPRTRTREHNTQLQKVDFQKDFSWMQRRGMKEYINIWNYFLISSSLFFQEWNDVIAVKRWNILQKCKTSCFVRDSLQNEQLEGCKWVNALTGGSEILQDVELVAFCFSRDAAQGRHQNLLLTRRHLHTRCFTQRRRQLTQHQLQLHVS